MLYVIHGTDIKKTRNKLNSLLGVLHKKRPEADVFKVSKENWSASFLDETLSGQNLFAPKNIIILDSLFEDKECAEYIESKIEVLSSSDHVCVIFDKKINASAIKKIEKNAEKIEEHNIVETKKTESPKTFDVAEALANKDKVQAWTLYIQLLNEGIPAEEIHGVIWWQFKSLLLTLYSKDQKESELNPYVYQKSKKIVSKWNEADLRGYIKKLVDIYHQAHRGEVDLYKEIELLCLR